MALTYAMTDLSVGKAVVLEGQPFVITAYQYLKSGPDAGSIRMTLKKLSSGEVSERIFPSNAELERAAVEKKSFEYLYDQGDTCVFLNSATFEPIEISVENVGGAKQFLKEGATAEVVFYEGQAIAVEPPPSVTLKIIALGPQVDGGSPMRQATLETGAIVSVPVFLNEGQAIRIDTRAGSYLERA